MHFTGSTVLAFLAASTFANAQATVYLIRHGEKPSDSSNGLSAQGMKRADCLPNVFGSSSNYHIGKLVAQDYKKDGSRKRPYDTLKPLSNSLGLPIDHSCDRDDPECVQRLVDNYTGPGNILICWEHKALTDIVAALGDSDPPTYPSDHFDLIWTDPYAYTDITSITSENCPGLDN